LRLQRRHSLLQGAAGGSKPYPSVLSALWQIGRAEGVAGLQRGLYPGCFWQFSNVSVRFGVYASFKRLSGTDETASPLRKYLQSLGLAGISGGLAALASNPFFIVKTRLQATSSSGALAVGQQHGAASGAVGGALAAIVRADGLPGLFRGLSAFAPRVIVASAVQLSTYDTVKGWVVSSCGLRPDQLLTHVASSFVTGAAVVAAMQPFDFAATRLVNSLSAAEAGGGGAAAYSSPWDVMRKTVASEGVLGLYSGGTANYLRFGPYCVLVFVFVERARVLEAAVLERLRR